LGFCCKLSAQASTIALGILELSNTVTFSPPVPDGGAKSRLDQSKKGKPLGFDTEGKPKRNLAPEAQHISTIHFVVFCFCVLIKAKVGNLKKPTCRIEKKIATLEGKIEKMEMNKKIKEDLKAVALGTSKVNYFDSRITVAWCKRHEVPIEKVCNFWF
jgi:DNA topoisomerase I